MSQFTPQRCQTNCTRKITLTPKIIYIQQIITDHDLQLRLPKIYTAAISIHTTATPLTSERSHLTPKRSLRECHRLGQNLQILRRVEQQEGADRWYIGGESSQPLPPASLVPPCLPWNPVVRQFVLHRSLVQLFVFAV